MNGFQKHWPRWVFLAWGILVLAVSVRSFVQPHRNNVYLVFARAGGDWLHGETCYDRTRTELDGYRYAPLASVSFVPWYLLPSAWGTALWRLASAGIFLAGFAWMTTALFKGRTLTQRDWALMLLAMIPLGIAGLNNGQANAHVIGLLLLATAACTRERWNVAAICIALATWLKIYPLAVGLLLIVVYPRPLLWRTALALASGFGLPFLTQRPDYVWNEYQRWIADLKGDDRRNFPFSLGYLDAHLLLRLLGIHLSHLAYGVMQMGAALLLAGFVWFRRSQPAILGHLLQLGSLWIILFGPSTEGSTYLLLAPTLAWALHQAWTDAEIPRWQRGCVILAGVLYLARLLLIALPGGRNLSFMLPPLMAVLLLIERSVRAWQETRPEIVVPPETTLRRVRVVPIATAAQASTAREHPFPVQSGQAD